MCPGGASDGSRSQSRLAVTITITIITITITIITNTITTTTITIKKGQPSSSPGGVVTGAPGHLSEPRRPIPPPKPSPTIVIDAPIISAIVFVIVITYSTTTIVTMSVTSAVATGGSSPRTPKVPLESPRKEFVGPGLVITTGQAPASELCRRAGPDRAPP